MRRSRSEETEAKLWGDSGGALRSITIWNVRNLATDSLWELKLRGLGGPGQSRGQREKRTPSADLGTSGERGCGHVSVESGGTFTQPLEASDGRLETQPGASRAAAPRGGSGQQRQRRARRPGRPSEPGGPPLVILKRVCV